MSYNELTCSTSLQYSLRTSQKKMCVQSASNYFSPNIVVRLLRIIEGIFMLIRQCGDLYTKEYPPHESQALVLGRISVVSLLWIYVRVLEWLNGTRRLHLLRSPLENGASQTVQFEKSVYLSQQISECLPLRKQGQRICSCLSLYFF